MKYVVQYQANDGSLFDSYEKATERDQELIVIEEITKACLKPVPKECNWKGYVQQHGPAVLDYKRTLMRIARTHAFGVSKECDCIWDMDPSVVHARGIAGRYIDDSGHVLLNRAWHRLMCMDEDFREYNQPFYVTHKSEAGEVCRG